VDSARVHVVRPEAALFSKAGKAASATVVVKLRGGFQLSASNVAAIVHLVAGSVEDLQPDRVVVVDTRGTLLSGEADDATKSRMASVLEQKRQVEEYLSQKAERQLALVLGPNRSAVQVSVEMDTTMVESETKKYGPGKGVLTKEMTKESLSTEPPRDKGAAPGKTSDSTTEAEYKVTETVERKVELAGTIMRKTVSVIVDLSSPNSEASGAATQPAKKLEVKDIEEIVKRTLGLKIAGEPGAAGAAGATGATGTSVAHDLLTVKEASFYRPPELAGKVEEAGLFTKDFLLEIAKRSSLGLLVLGALLALRMFRGPGRRAAALEGGAEAALLGQGAAAGMLPGGIGEVNPDVLKAQITRALKDNPEEVKRLFMSWVDSEKGGA